MNLVRLCAVLTCQLLLVACNPETQRSQPEVTAAVQQDAGTSQAQRTALAAEAARIVETGVYPAWREAVAELRRQ